MQHHAQLPDKGPCNAADSPVNGFEALEQQVVGGPTQVNDLGDPTACSTIEEPTADIDNVDISKKQPQVTLFNFVRGGGGREWNHEGNENFFFAVRPLCIQ